MQWLNYHHLYYFYVIASEGSITKATEKLKLAQSTLSAQLKIFEESIGHNLFDRSRRTLHLTEVGRLVYDYANEIFALGEELRDSLGDPGKSLESSIRIGVMDATPQMLNVMIYEMIQKEHGAQVYFVKDSLEMLYQKLERHEIDVILVSDNSPLEGENSKFHAKLIGGANVILVTSSQYAHLKKDSPRSLEKYPMILPGGDSPLRQEVLEYFRIKHLTPHVVSEVDDLELRKMMVLAGHGYTVLPVMAIEEELKNGSLISLSPTPICRENLWLITAHRLVHHPISRFLLKTFRLSEEK